jgi:hypothetical protein
MGDGEDVYLVLYVVSCGTVVTIPGWLDGHGLAIVARGSEGIG